MQTTTIYTKTLIITTDDDGTQTMERTSSADTQTAYLFDELSEDAKARAISDAIRDEESEYYSTGAYGASQTGVCEAEIWDAAEELENVQPIVLGTDQGGSPYGTAHRYHWSTADWENVTEQQHNGMCCSMDICDVWNAYAARIIALQEGYEEANDRAYIHDENADNAADNGNDRIEQAERNRAAFYSDIAERIEETAEELTEEAARAVGNIVEGLIEAERDYYTSPEFWREWLSDGETRFTRDGERI